MRVVDRLAIAACYVVAVVVLVGVYALVGFIGGIDL